MKRRRKKGEQVVNLKSMFIIVIKGSSYFGCVTVVSLIYCCHGGGIVRMDDSFVVRNRLHILLISSCFLHSVFYLLLVCIIE